MLQVCTWNPQLPLHIHSCWLTPLHKVSAARGSPAKQNTSARRRRKPCPVYETLFICWKYQSSFKSSQSFTKLLCILRYTQEEVMLTCKHQQPGYCSTVLSHSLTFSLPCQCYHLMAESEYLTQLPVESILEQIHEMNINHKWLEQSFNCSSKWS